MPGAPPVSVPVLTYHYSGSFPVRGGVMVGAGVWRHGAGGDPPPMPQCVGLSCRFSGRATPQPCQNSDKAIEKIDTTSSHGETSLHSPGENSP
jgi:hypothetical protein